MRPAQAYKVIQEQTASVVSEAKMKNVQAVLSFLKINSGWDDITPQGAAWAIFTALGAPNSNYLDLLMWVKDRQADEIFNSPADRPVNFLAALLWDGKFANEVKAVGITPEGILLSISTTGETMTFPKKTAEKLDVAKILSNPHQMTIIPGVVLREIARLVEVAQKVGA